MSKFSKQHYVAVAQIIKAQVDHALAHPYVGGEVAAGNEKNRRDVISSLAGMFNIIFESDNPRYHSPTFYEACNLPAGAWPDEPMNNHYTPLPRAAVEGYIDSRTA